MGSTKLAETHILFQHLIVTLSQRVAAGSILGYLDSQLFMNITNQFLPAGFVGDSHSFCAPQATQKCLWVYYTQGPPD